MFKQSYFLQQLEGARLQLRQSELDAWMALYDYVGALNALELAMLGSV
jgi:hypothetical protein